MFSVGKAVEVSFEKKDAWYPATVVHDFGNGCFSVKSDVRDDDEVSVDSLHIRPLPPNLNNYSNFSLLEKVDAFYDFGWWSGIITKLLPHGTFLVYFKHFNIEKEICSFQLRPHMDWKDGKWFTYSQGVLIPPDCSIEGDNNCNSGLNQRTAQLGSSGNIVEASQIACSTDCNEKPYNAMVSPKKRQHVSSSINFDALLSPQVLQEEQILTASCTLKTKEFEALTNEIPSGFQNSTSEETRNVSTSVGVDQFSGKIIRKKCQKISEQDISVSDVQLFQARQKNLPAKGTKLPIQGKEAARSVAENDETRVAIVMGLECISVMKSSRNETSYHMDGKECSDSLRGQNQHINNLPLLLIKESEQLGNAESNQKKKRGRPKGSAVTTSKAPALLSVNAESSQKKNRGRPKGSVVNTSKAPVPLQDNTEISQKRKRGRPRMSAVNTSKMHAPLSVNIENSQKKKRGRPRRSAPLPGLIKGKKEHMKGRGWVKKVVQTNNEKVFRPEKQTLKKGKRQTKSVIAESQNKGLSPARNTEEHSEASDKSNEIVMQTPVDNGDANMPIEIQNRNSLLWATIESMDAFRRFPQKPHFRPLEHVKESSREGLAIGYMVTFSSVVDRCCRLRLEDSRSTIQEILGTLDDLGAHGFDVQHLRDRLYQILLFKDKEENLKLQSVEIDGEIVKHDMEKKEIDEEMESIKKQIAGLEEKIALATSRKEAKDLEIASLQCKMDNIRGDITNLRTDYEDFLSKPLP